MRLKYFYSQLENDLNQTMQFLKSEFPNAYVINEQHKPQLKSANGYIYGKDRSNKHSYLKSNDPFLNEFEDVKLMSLSERGIVFMQIRKELSEYHRIMRIYGSCLNHSWSSKNHTQVILKVFKL